MLATCKNYLKNLYGILKSIECIQSFQHLAARKKMLEGSNCLSNAPRYPKKKILFCLKIPNFSFIFFTKCYKDEDI